MNKEKEIINDSQEINVTKNTKKIVLSILIGVLCVLLIVVGIGIYIFYHYFNLLDNDSHTQQIDSQVIGNENVQLIEFDESINNDYDVDVIEASEEDIIKIEEKLQSNQEEMDKNSDLYNTDVFNLLLIGVDSRKDNYTGRSDAMILVSINKDTKHIVMTSVLRDTYVSIPEYGNNRLNAAYAYGGEALLSETIKNNFGITVDRYATVNFYIVMDLVDAVGGVDIELSADVIEVMNKSYIPEMNRLLGHLEGSDLLPMNLAGTKVHLNGKQALAYARVRYVGTDFARTTRQREIIMLCLEKIKGMSIIEINNLAEQFLPRIRTDLTELDCASLLFMVPTISSYSFDNMHIPIDGSWENARINGMAVLTVDFKKNIEAWYELVSK